MIIYKYKQNKINMKTLFYTFLLILSLISTDLSANGNLLITSNCGLKTESGALVYDDYGMVQIDTENGELCENDLARKGFIYVFGKFLTDNYFVLNMVEGYINLTEQEKLAIEDNFTAQLIYTVMQSFFYALAPFAFAFFIYKTVMGMRNPLTKGAFAEDPSLKGVLIKNTTVFLATMAITAPVFDGLPLLSFMLLSLGIVAMYLSNLLLAGIIGVFMNLYKPNEINHSSLKEVVYKNVEDIISGNLCELQTRQALLNVNYAADSIFTEKSWYEDVFIIGSLFGKDNRIALNKVNACTSYFETYDIEDNKMYGITLGLKEYKSCDTTSREYSPLKRVSEQTGFANECFKASFTWENPENIEPLLTTDNSKTEYRNIKNERKNNFQGKFDFETIFLSNKSKLHTAVLNYINGTQEASIESKKYLDNLNIIARQLADSIKDSPFLSINDRMTNDEIKVLSKIRHQSALNYMLGAYTNEDLTKIHMNRSDKLKKVQVSNLADVGVIGRVAPLYETIKDFSSADTTIQRLFDDIAITGFGVMNKDYYSHIAKNILRLQCFETLARNVALSRETLETFETLSKDPRNIQARTQLNFDCIDIIKSSNDEYARVEHLIISQKASHNPFKKENFISYTTRNEKNAMEAITRDQALIEKYLKDTAEILMEEIELMRAYNYVVRLAVHYSLVDNITKNTNQDLLIKTRQMGIIGVGALLPMLSKETRSVNSLLASLNTTFTTESYLGGFVGNGKYFANWNVFNDNNKDTFDVDIDKVNKIQEIDGFRLSFINHTAGGMTSTSEIVDSDKQERTIVDKLYRLVYNFTIGDIIDVIKVGTGIVGTDNVNNSYIKSLEECYKSSACMPESSPYGSVIHSGQMLFERAIYLLIVKKALNSVSDKLDDLPPALKANPAMMLLGSIIKIALNTVLLFLNVISPFLYAFLFIGFINGYILPIMPLIFTILWYITFILGIVSLMIGLPINYIMKLRMDENGKMQFDIMNTSKELLSFILAPAFFAVGLVMFFAVSSVSIYLLNTLSFSIFDNTINDSGLTGFIGSIIFMFIHLLLISILMFFSVKMITQTTSMITRTTGLNDYTNIQGLKSALAFNSVMVSNKVANTLSVRDGKVDISTLKREDQPSYTDLKKQILLRNKPE